MNGKLEKIKRSQDYFLVFVGRTQCDLNQGFVPSNTQTTVFQQYLIPQPNIQQNWAPQSNVTTHSIPRNQRGPLPALQNFGSQNCFSCYEQHEYLAWRIKLRDMFAAKELTYNQFSKQLKEADNALKTLRFHTCDTKLTNYQFRS